MLPDAARAWAENVAPHPAVGVTAIGGGITNTKGALHLSAGDPLVIRWSDPAVRAVGREHVRREALALRLSKAEEDVVAVF